MTKQHIVLVAIPKGGSGKTSAATSLAIVMALAGKRTLLIDLDYQANATSVMVGSPASPAHTIGAQLVMAAQGMTPKTNEAIEHDVRVPGLDMLASDEVSANVAGSVLSGLPGRRGDEMLGVVLAEVSDYEYVFIDSCPKLIDPFVSSALRVSDGVLIPVVPEAWAVAGIAPLVGQIDSYRQVNEKLEILGVLATRVPTNRRAARDAVAALAHSRLNVFAAMIRETTEVNAAHNDGVPAVLRSKRIAEDYNRLAVEIDELYRKRDADGYA